MKKIIAAFLVTSMLVVPCASYTSADFLKDQCYNFSLCKKAWEHPITKATSGLCKIVLSSIATATIVLYRTARENPKATAAFVLLHLADKGLKKVEPYFDLSDLKHKGGYTHSEKESKNKYSLPCVNYNKKDIYSSEPGFTALPASDPDCNVYYSSTGKFELKLTDEQKKHFSDRGYISVKLRKVPQKEIGSIKKPFVWAYHKLTGKKPYSYNKFYIHGPNLAKPSLKNYFKQFLPFVDSEPVPFLPCASALLPWNNDDNLPGNENNFVRLNYGIVLTDKDEEKVLNFKAPSKTDYTKEYQDIINLNAERASAHEDDKIKAPTSFDSIEEITKIKNGNKVQYIKKHKANKPDTTKKYYTEDDIKKLKADNEKKKAKILDRLANACQNDYLTEGEIARLSLANPDQTFRLVINNATGTWDADKLSALLSRTDEYIPLNDMNPSLLFDFEYVLPLPERLQVASKEKQPNADNTLKENKAIVIHKKESLKDKVVTFAKNAAEKVKNKFNHKNEGNIDVPTSVQPQVDEDTENIRTTEVDIPTEVQNPVEEGSQTVAQDPVIEEGSQTADQDPVIEEGSQTEAEPSNQSNEHAPVVQVNFNINNIGEQLVENTPNIPNANAN